MIGDSISGTETESRWMTAVLSANQAVWDHDFERNQHYLSETWRTLRGLSIDDEQASPRGRVDVMSRRRHRRDRALRRGPKRPRIEEATTPGIGRRRRCMKMA